MIVSKDGHRLKQNIYQEITKCDQKYQQERQLKAAVERLSLARILKLLFNDESEILKSQLILSEEYFNSASFELAESYATEILNKDNSFTHRIKAQMILLKIKVEQKDKASIIDHIDLVKKKYENSEVWTDEIKMQIAKIQSKVYKGIQQYDKSIEMSKEIIKQLQQDGKQNSQQHVQILLMDADSYYQKGDYLKATTQQKKAINICEIYNKSDRQKLVKMYITLSKYEQKADQTLDEYNSLKKAQSLHKLKKSNVDKLMIDIKKRICKNLEGRSAYVEAIKQFDILKQLIDEKFGSFSLQMADTKKRLANIFQLLGKKNEAMTQYSQAANIYSQNKDKKLTQQCRRAMYNLRPNRLQIYKSTPPI